MENWGKNNLDFANIIGLLEASYLSPPRFPVVGDNILWELIILWFIEILSLYAWIQGYKLYVMDDNLMVWGTDKQELIFTQDSYKPIPISPTGESASAKQCTWRMLSTSRGDNCESILIYQTVTDNPTFELALSHILRLNVFIITWAWIWEYLFTYIHFYMKV